MQLIAADIGNHAIKLGLFTPESLRESPPVAEKTLTLPYGDCNPSEIGPWLPLGELHWVLSSVTQEGSEWLTDWITESRSKDEVFSLTSADLPMEIEVPSPEYVGMDRLCATLAAKSMFAESNARPIIVVCAGTAITVNAVSARGAFRGGAILPGLSLAARSLADGTDALSLVDPTTPPASVIGKTTEEAICSGIYWGTIGAAGELVERFRETLGGSARVIVTGGDGEILSSHLGQTTTYHPNLVLQGIALVTREGLNEE